MTTINVILQTKPTIINAKYAKSMYEVAVDGITITGTGRPGDPLKFIGTGTGVSCDDIAACPIIIAIASALSNKSDVGHTHAFSEITGKPTTVGGYGITDAMTTSHPANAVNNTLISQWNAAYGWGNHASAGYVLATSLAAVATSGSYSDLSGTPSIPTQVSQLANDSGYITSSALSPYLTTTAAAYTYQPILVSGTTIKTINGTSLLGAGDITISAAAALSGITAATAAHTINNAAFQQEWQWNSLASGIGFKITTSSAAATGNNQVLVELRKTGVTSGTSSGSVLLNIVNEDTNPSSLVKAAHFEAKNFAATFGKAGFNAGYGDIGIFGNSKVSFYQNSTESVFFRKKHNVDYFEMVASTAGYIFQVGTTNQVRFLTSTGVPFLGYYHNGSSKQTQLFNAVSDGTIYPSGTHASLFENENGVFKFSANSGLTSGVGFTPNWQLVLHGSNNNVGIGTLTPNASAKLDVSSTTQGFAMPEMTATQASAISTTSRKLIIYVTDTNGTFTSAGLWMWTGATWKLILAQ